MHFKLIKYSTNKNASYKEIFLEQNLFSTGNNTSLSTSIWKWKMELEWTSKKIKQHNIQGHRDQEPDFHYKFKTIINKPRTIYYQWNIELLNQPLLGIVWPRLISTYTKQILNELFQKLPHFNLATISGLAEWTDQLAHKLSIENSIPTIAVLWWGLLYYQNNYNSKKINKIIENWGLILSEYKLYQEPQKYTFPQRNRIIAGLSDVLFIPEAGKKSGSLITADFAYKMNKPIYGTPNTIFNKNSFWLHEAIYQRKITLSINAKNFLYKHFSPKQRSKIEISSLDSQEQKIYKYISEETITITQLSSKFPEIWTARLITILNILEIKQYIFQTSPWKYNKKSTFI